MMNTNRIFATIGAATVLLALFTGIVLTQGKGPKRRYINLPKKAVKAQFSEGVLAVDTLYWAGRLGLDPKTNQIPADTEQEARLMLDGIKAVLTEAGMTMDDLVTVQVFCSDVSLFDKFNPIYRSYFTKNVPARAFIGSGTLLRGARF